MYVYRIAYWKKHSPDWFLLAGVVACVLLLPELPVAVLDFHAGRRARGERDLCRECEQHTEHKLHSDLIWIEVNWLSNPNERSQRTEWSNRWLEADSEHSIYWRIGLAQHTSWPHAASGRYRRQLWLQLVSQRSVHADGHVNSPINASLYQNFEMLVSHGARLTRAIVQLIWYPNGNLKYFIL